MSIYTNSKIVKQALILYEKGFVISNIINILQRLYSKRSNKNVEMIIKNSIETTRSLTIAINQAEGDKWPTSKLCKMTALDLISIIAPNRIRFIYIKNHQIDKNKYYKKINKLQRFVDNMIEDFKEQLEDDGSNMLAAFGIETYEEIKKQLDN